MWDALWTDLNLATMSEGGEAYGAIARGAIGVDEEMAHTSIRFGIGRFTTDAEVDYAIELIVQQAERLRAMSPLWEMAQAGVDLKSIQWAAH